MSSHARTFATAFKFIGLDTQYPTADGRSRTRLHFDGAASPLAAQCGLDAIHALLPHYSNSHSYVHNCAQISTQALAQAHRQVLTTLGADEQDYTAIFTGAGSTAAINRVARGLVTRAPEKGVVLVSFMEHHANDLPHRATGNTVDYMPLTGEGQRLGAVDLTAFEGLCQQYQGRLNYVAVSAVSNVTGIANPIEDICQIAHHYGALVLVDGAQSVAHKVTQLSQTDTAREADFFVFSGHKVYTPTAPGVLVAKKAVLAELSGQDLGGGSVETVTHYDYQLLNDYPDREQSGTPNILGAVALAQVLCQLDALGFDKIEQHSAQLTRYLVEQLNALPNITVYGDLDIARCGAVAFNHAQIDHGLLAAVLNDYHAIAVRNECFCAHPYVSSLLKTELWEIDLTGIAPEDHEMAINRRRGMVRASVSLYTTQDAIDQLISALIAIEQNDYRDLYQVHPDGSYTHRHFTLDWQQTLSDSHG